MFLDRRKVNGEKPDSTWEILTPLLGEPLTLNFGESPNVANVSTLSSILEDNVPVEYVLSERGCLGILRRSEERGKPLPDLLIQALWNTIWFQRSRGGVTKVIESHPQDCRVTLPDGETVQTLASRMGTGGNNVSMVAMPVSAGLMRNPSGDAGGIGYEEEKSPTLLADRPPAVMTPVLCMATAQANAEVTKNVAPTITAAAGMSGNNQPMVAVPVCLASTDRKAEITDGSISPTLLARAGTGGGNVPMIAVPLQLTSSMEVSREEQP